MAPSASVRARSSAEMAPQPISDDAPAPVKENGLAALAAINAAAAATVPKPPEPELQPDGRYKLTEEAGYKHTAFAFPTWKKWAVLTTIFIVQLSMNWNAAIYGNAIPGLKEDFGVSDGLVRIGQMVFLVAYAFGCELWAPWSEELGRKWVLQGSLFLVNVWQVACALSPSFASIILFRGLGGLSSAGGSVTLGMVWNLLRHGWMSHPASSFVADMWEPQEHQYAVAYVVFSSVCGSVIAPIAGGFIATYLSWQWVFWVSLIFGAVAQLLHLFTPETRSDVMLDRRAQHLRKTGEHTNLYGLMELRGTFRERTSLREAAETTWLPFKFLITEPIVTFLSLLSGFSDALIFTGLDSFSLVLSKWNFSVIAVGLSFIPLLIGYIIGYGSFIPRYWCDIKRLREAPDTFKPERRLLLLLFLVPLEPIGLFILGACGVGPPAIRWMGPMVATALIGIANFAIYMATIDYMVAAYGPRAASATGGNGFCRDFLAGVAALYARPLYSNIMPGTKWQLPIPSFILGGIAILLCIPVYVFYIWGAWFRMRSPYASELQKKRDEKEKKRQEAVRDSREGSPWVSRVVSRRASLDKVRPGAGKVGKKQPPSPKVAERDGSVSTASFHA